MVAQYDLDFLPMEWDAQAALKGQYMQQTIQSGRLNALLTGKAWAVLREIHHAATRAAWSVSEWADMLVFKTAIPAGGSIAEIRGIPAVEAGIVPWMPSADLPPLALLGKPTRFGPFLNRAGGKLVRLFLWQILRHPVNSFRREQGLPPLSWRGLPPAHCPPQLPQMIAISPTVLPCPVDWGEGMLMTGYWFLEAATDWVPPAYLEDFLKAGPPPVCIGFGSMTNDKPQETLALIVEAVTQAGVRAVVMGGWAGLKINEQVPSSICLVDEAPFDWLYPRCAAVVHHGGAGTTATALRAGVPAVIVPHNFDQPLWGQQVAHLGAGTAPLPFHQLTVERLAARLHQVTTNPSLSQRAAQIGTALRAEDGIDNAARFIESVVVAWNQQRGMTTVALATS
jgi:UDP:flavonoid glycosyltransferase YjiC (YdhE family)